MDKENKRNLGNRTKTPSQEQLRIGTSYHDLSLDRKPKSKPKSKETPPSKLRLATNHLSVDTQQAFASAKGDKVQFCIGCGAIFIVVIIVSLMLTGTFGVRGHHNRQ
jgi:hypothetical protein